MTEPWTTPRAQKKTGISRQRKANLKIDMTPMVDLGFLLISFFIFTTEISKPFTTNLSMPRDGAPSLVAESKTLTILLDSSDQVSYYFGNLNHADSHQGLRLAFCTENSLGNIIRQKQAALKKRGISPNELVVIIKPGVGSSYGNILNVLDEMLINAVSRYSIADQTDEEEDALTTHTFPTLHP